MLKILFHLKFKLFEKLVNKLQKDFTDKKNLVYDTDKDL